MLPPDAPFPPNGAGFNHNGRGRCGGRGGGRGGNGQASGTVRSTNATGSNNNGSKQQKPPCILCGDNHYHNLLYCKELPKYLAHGNNQKVLPNSVCQVCLCTGSKQSCGHGCNKQYQATLCSTSGKHFLMCTDCAKHVPALQYLQENHDAKSDWSNLHFLRGAFGSEAYKAMCAPISVTTCNSNTLLHEAADDETRCENVTSDETDSIQIWPALIPLLPM